MLQRLISRVAQALPNRGVVGPCPAHSSHPSPARSLWTVCGAPPSPLCPWAQPRPTPFHPSPLRVASHSLPTSSRPSIRSTGAGFDHRDGLFFSATIFARVSWSCGTPQCPRIPPRPRFLGAVFWVSGTVRKGRITPASASPHRRTQAPSPRTRDESSLIDSQRLCPRKIPGLRTLWGTFL